MKTKTLCLCSVDYVPVMRCLFMERLPRPLPRGYCGGRIPSTVCNVSPEAAAKLCVSLLKRGFEMRASHDAAHYRRSPARFLSDTRRPRRALSNA
jgi:hypothetical protein